MPKIDNTPRALKPYAAYGIILTEQGDNAKGDCPFCGREGKLSVSVATGVAHCWACTLNPEAPGGGVNVLTFLRRLWEESVTRTSEADLEGLREDRGYANTAGLVGWGCARSITTDEWIIPGYDAQIRMCQLYRWVTTSKGRVLMATPKTGDIPSAGLFMSGWDNEKDEVYIAEGPWDGIALEEHLGRYKQDISGGAVRTSSSEHSYLAKANVVSVPGCGSIGEPFRAWLPLFRNRHVILCCDDDDAGRGASRRAAEILAGEASAVSWVEWPREPWGGKDIRDMLVETKSGVSS